MSTTANKPSSSPRTLNLLFLHGFTQSGPLFHAKTRALEKHLQKAFPAAPKPGSLPNYPGGVNLSYPTGPIKLSVSDIPGHESSKEQDQDHELELPSGKEKASTSNGSGKQSGGHGDGEDLEAYAWWRRQGDAEEDITYTGLENTIRQLAHHIQTTGPYDGVIGFSQGGCLTSVLCSLLEPGRLDRLASSSQSPKGEIDWSSLGSEIEILKEHGTAKFGVVYSGFKAAGPRHAGFYEPKITTPILHFFGSVDTVVEESRGLALVHACDEESHGSKGKKGERVVYHPGGHFLPSSQKQWVAPLIAFIREIVGGEDGGSGGKKEEEKVEDMDMPF